MKTKVAFVVVVVLTVLVGIVVTQTHAFDIDTVSPDQSIARSTSMFFFACPHHTSWDADPMYGVHACIRGKRWLLHINDTRQIPRLFTLGYNADWTEVDARYNGLP